MNRFLLFTLSTPLFFFSFSAHSKNQCIDIFVTSASTTNSNKKASSKENKQTTKKLKTTESKNKKSAELTEQEEFNRLVDKYHHVVEHISGIRTQISVLQRMTGDVTRQALFDHRLKNEKLKFFTVYANDLKTAVDQVQSIFIDVEGNWFKLQRIYKAEQEGQKSPYSMDEIQKFKTEFARSFEDYVYIRSTLEKLIKLDIQEIATVESSDNLSINPSHLAKENASFLLNHLGIPNLISKGDALYLQRPPLEEIIDFFKDHHDLLIIKIKHELEAQRKRTVNLLAFTLFQVELIQTQIIRFLPRPLRPIAGAALALNYNEYVLKTYLPNIIKVLDTPNQLRYQRYTVLRTLAAEKDTLEFLITFARLSFFTKQWVELKTDAENSIKETGSPLFKKFYDQMILAETIATKSTWLSPFYKPAIIDHVRKWGASLSFWVILLYYISDDQNRLHSEDLVLLDPYNKDQEKAPETPKSPPPRNLRILEDNPKFNEIVQTLNDFYVWFEAMPGQKHLKHWQEKEQ